MAGERGDLVGSKERDEVFGSDEPRTAASESSGPIRPIFQLVLNPALKFCNRSFSKKKCNRFPYDKISCWPSKPDNIFQFDD